MTPTDIDKDLDNLGVTHTTSKFERQFYSRELIALPRWVGHMFKTMPAAVVKPGVTEEVASVVSYCYERGIPLVPRGAGTLGLLGSVPKEGGIVLDLTALKAVEVNESEQIAHVDAGITCAELERELRRHGLAMRSYPSSALSATLGGWIMGSGLGIGSLTYGPVFDHIISAEVVFSDGTVRTIPAGKDLEWLWKSEGTLAVLVRVSLKVRKVPESTHYQLISFDDHGRLFDFVRLVAGGSPLPYSVEVFDRSYCALLQKAGYDIGLYSGGLTLVAYEADRDAVEQAKVLVERERRGCKGETREGAERAWENRFNMWRIKRAMPTLLPIGVFIPLSRLADFHSRTIRNRKRPLASFGQVVSPVECLVMVLVSTDQEHPFDHTLALHLPRKLYSVALSLGGRPGGGVGVLNAPYRKTVVGPAKAETLKRQKMELDPKGILNPGMGKLVPPILYHPAMRALSLIDRLFPRPSVREKQGLERELDACVQCGYCTVPCPTRGDWISSSPRGRIQLAGATPQEGSPDLVRSIFSCTLCGRCAVDCMVSIDSPALWVESRGRLVRKGYELENLKSLSAAVVKSGNIAGRPNAQRIRWAARLPFFGDISSRTQAKAVYFGGCVTSFYPTVQDIGRSFVSTLVAAHVDFMLLGEKEMCCGYPLISSGHVDQAVAQMRQNIDAVKETGADTLLVTCPGCYRMWKHEYQRLTGETSGIDVIHSTEFLQDLIATGKIRLGAMNGKMTYHDPCDLGRVSGIFEAPRSILKALKGADYIELEESRRHSVCCGSGGDLLASNQELSLRLAQKRLDQALIAGADTIVTACPSCIRGMGMAKLAVKSQLTILDIAQVVWKALER